MNEGFIEQYTTFNTKGCPEDLIFGDLNNQPIPSTYSDLTNNYDGNDTPIDASQADNKGVEYTVVPNDEDNDCNRLQKLTPSQTIFRKLKECTEWSIEPKKGK